MFGWGFAGEGRSCDSSASDASSSSSTATTLQILLAGILDVKKGAHSAYELARSFDLEDELDASPIDLASLAEACSPATRVGLGCLRFFVSWFAGRLSGMFLLFGKSAHNPLSHVEIL